MNSPYKIEVLLDKPIQTVWEAITNPDKMKDWYFDVPAFKPELGSKFSFPGGPPDKDPYIHLCEVTAVVIGKSISYSWCYEGYTGYSEVKFDLQEQDEKTKLTLSHGGIESFPVDNQDFNISNFEAGWKNLIGSALPEYLNK